MAAMGLAHLGRRAGADALDRPAQARGAGAGDRQRRAALAARRARQRPRRRRRRSGSRRRWRRTARRAARSSPPSHQPLGLDRRAATVDARMTALILRELRLAATRRRGPAAAGLLPAGRDPLPVRGRAGRAAARPHRRRRPVDGGPARRLAAGRPAGRAGPRRGRARSARGARHRARRASRSPS